MVRGGQVNFIYKWEDLPEGYTGLVGDSIILYVSAKISDYHPAVRYLCNGDPGWDAEGGGVEDLEVSLPDGSFMDPIPDDLYDALCTEAQEEHTL